MNFHKALQRNDQDIKNVMGLVRICKTRLQNLREFGWDGILEKVTRFCTKRSISVPNMDEIIPRHGRAKRGDQQMTYLHHYRVEIFYQVIDLVTQELNSHFSETSTELLLCIACLNPSDSFLAYNNDKLVRLVELYPMDFLEYDCILLKNQLETS